MNTFNHEYAKQLRINKGMTQEDVAKTLGITNISYSQYERGVREPDNNVIAKLANVFDCRFLDLLLLNVSIIDNIPFTQKNIDDIDGCIVDGDTIKTLSYAEARACLEKLNKVTLPIFLNRLSYQPKGNDIMLSEEEMAYLSRCTDVINRMKAMVVAIEKKVPPQIAPLRHHIVFPRLKSTSYFPLIDAMTKGLQTLHRNRKLLLPDFSDTRTIAVFSDYGGDSKKEKYLSYSYLFADYDSVGANFHYAMNIIRNKYFQHHTEKEISFKNIEHAHIKKSIWEYLCRANDCIHGLLFTLMIDRRIPSLFGNKKENSAEVNKLTNVGWKPNILEKMLRINSVIAYFLQLLGSDNQKVFWLTDDDAIVENKQKTNATVQTLSNLLNAFEHKTNFATLGIGKASDFSKDDQFSFIDALSITDVVGGAINHYFTQEKKSGKNFEIKEQADMICKWLTEQGICLNKINILIEPMTDDSARLKIMPFNFSMKEGVNMPSEVKYIYTEYPTVIT